MKELKRLKKFKKIKRFKNFKINFYLHSMMGGMEGFELSSQAVVQKWLAKARIIAAVVRCQLEANIQYSSLLVTRTRKEEQAKPTRVERTLEVALELTLG